MAALAVTCKKVPMILRETRPLPFAVYFTHAAENRGVSVQNTEGADDEGEDGEFLVVEIDSRTGPGLPCRGIAGPGRCRCRCRLGGSIEREDGRRGATRTTLLYASEAS